MKRFVTVSCWLGIALCAAASAAAGKPAERVIILANRDDPDSLRIAEHYREARQVPAGNLIALPLSRAEAISWPEFVTTLWQPLLDELVRGRWVDAIPMDLTDAVGRRKYAPHGHRVAALVVCRGVPLKIAHDPAYYAEVMPLTRRGEFRTNAGAVDAELSLLAAGNYPINAFVPNRLFQNERPTEEDLRQVIKVARLDGPAPEHALALIDRALVAERTGLLGRAYIDLAKRDPLGDGWLESAAQQIVALGFETAIDREPATFPATARMDAPALYFGWYHGELNGPFALPGFRFPAGALGLHIHSSSAHTLRSLTSGWTGPLVARGITATVGNVFEPYLQLTHHPHLLVRALVRGATLADAAYYSLPALSWQAILIGDPLYRPFARSLDEQLAKPSDLPPLLAGYASLRRVQDLDAKEQRTEAVTRLQAAHRTAPSLALAVELARRWREAGDRESAARVLGFVPLLKSIPTDQWALARAAAQLLETCGQPDRAVQTWRMLLGQTGMPVDVRIPWLGDARAAAVAAKDWEQQLAWERDLAKLTAPDVKK